MQPVRLCVSQFFWNIISINNYSEHGMLRQIKQNYHNFLFLDVNNNLKVNGGLFCKDLSISVIQQKELTELICFKYRGYQILGDSEI